MYRLTVIKDGKVIFEDTYPMVYDALLEVEFNTDYDDADKITIEKFE